MIEGPKLEFYVLNYDWNKKKVFNYNIFDNYSVYKCVVKETKKYLRAPRKYKFKRFDETETIYGFDALVKEIDRIVRWQEWARCEYEIYVGDAFEEDVSKYEKWDCYQQFTPNKEMFTQYVIKQVRNYYSKKDK